MSFDPKRAATMSVGAALSDAIAATRRDFIPLGLVVTAISLIPLIGGLIVPSLLVTAALRDLRGDAPFSVRATFDALSERIGVFIATYLVALLAIALFLFGFLATFFVLYILFLVAASSALEDNTPSSGGRGNTLVVLLTVPLFLIHLGLRFIFIYYAAFDGKSGVDAFRHSFALTLGSTLRILGWLIIAGLVSALLLLAAFALGVVLSLLLPGLGIGIGLPALFAAAIAGAMITTRMLATLYLVLSARSSNPTHAEATTPR